MGFPNLQGVVDTLKKDVGRAGLQARNGIKHVAGINHMKVGQTPKDVVWQRGKTQLWRYKCDEITQPVPIVIVYSVLSRSYMFDLYPGHSFVEHLGNMGYDVYLLDWGVADERESGYKLETYVDEHLPAALRAAAKESGSESLFVIGYCFGGTLAAMSLPDNPGPKIAGLVLMATPIDYHELGLFTELFGPRGRLNTADMIDGTGNVPANASRDVFRLLKPTSQLAAKVTLLEKVWDDDFLKGYQAMGQWSRDHVPFSGAAFRQTVQLLFRRNALVNKNLFLGGRRVDTSRLKMPVLVLVAEKDHIVPLKSALAGAEIVGSDDVETARLPFGHVGLVVGRAATARTIPTIVDWIERHSPSKRNGKGGKRAGATVQP
jgi:poly[(R)-3-hydroxyalkanoate] polymerase subunit PhaC